MAGAVKSITVVGGRIAAASGGLIDTPDLTATGVVAGSYTSAAITVGADGRIAAASSGAGGGTGTVTSVGLALPPDVFGVSGSPVTTSGTLTGGFVAQSPNTVFAGPSAGPGGTTPTFRPLVPADLPVFGPSGATSSAGAVPDPGATAGAARFLREDATWAAPAGGGGTVTSVDASGGTTGLTFGGGPITASGTLTLGGTLAVASGGTSSTTPETARRNLGVDQLTTGPDAAYTIPATDRVIEVTPLTAPRTYTLPVASTLNPGQSLAVYTVAGGVSPTNRLTVARAATDSIELDGMAVTSVDLTDPGTVLLIWSNGGTRWFATVVGGRNTGDVTLAGAGYLTITGQTITAGTVGATAGGTGFTGYAVGDMLAADTAGSLTKITGQTTTTRKFLRQTGTGSGSAVPVWDTLTNADMPAGVSFAAPASQADQESASAVSGVFVTPGRQQYHPSAAKAWVSFSLSGTTVTINASYNVASVARTGTGIYTITFTTAFSTASYAVALGMGNVAGTGNTLANWQSKAAGSCQVVFTGASFGTPTDTGAQIDVAFYGDQA